MAMRLFPTRVGGLCFRALCLGLLLAAAGPARAQSPADTAAILLDAAGRLTLEGRDAAARQLLDYIRSHYALTPAAGEAARRLEAAPGPEAPVAPASARARRLAAGRTELMVWGTTYGIWAGLATPPALHSSSPTAYGLGLLLGAPAGFILSKTYADRMDITEGAARSITFGGSWGTWQGFGLARMLGLLDHKEHICVPTEPPQCYDSKSESGEAVVRSMLVGGLAGIGAGAVIGQRNRVSPGTATTVNLAALWGTWYGAGTAWAAGMDGDGPMALALVGGDVALLGAAMVAPRARISRERARLISIAGLAGVLAGGGVDLLLRVDNRKVGLAIPLATGTAGLLLGTYATSDMPLETAAGAPSPGGAEGGSLLRMDGGRLGMGMPMPAPVLRPASARGNGLTPAVYVPLLSATF